MRVSTAEITLCVSHTNNQYQQTMHTPTLNNTHAYEVHVLVLAFSWFQPEREQRAGKTPWWHWLTHFCATLSLMWPAGKPEDTHKHTHTHTWNCLPTYPWGPRGRTTKCCWWLSLSPSHPSVFSFLSFCLRINHLGLCCYLIQLN